MEALIVLVIFGVIIWAIASSGSGASSRSTTKSNSGRDRKGRQRRTQSGGRSQKRGGEKDTGSSISIEVRTSTGRASSPSAEEPLSQSQSAWVPPGSSFTLGGRKISGGMAYVGTELQPVDGCQSADPRLIGLCNSCNPWPKPSALVRGSSEGLVRQPARLGSALGNNQLRSRTDHPFRLTQSCCEAPLQRGEVHLSNRTKLSGQLSGLHWDQMSAADLRSQVLN